MPSDPIEVVCPTSDLEEQRAEISKVVTQVLVDLVSKLTEAGTGPLIVCVGIAAESGVYTNGLSRSDLKACDMSTDIITELADLIKNKITKLPSVTCYPSSDAPSS